MNFHHVLFTFFLLPAFIVSSQENGVTFEVDDVTLASTKLNEVTFDVFVKNHFKQKVYSFPQELKGETIIASRGNGFLKTNTRIIASV